MWTEERKQFKYGVKRRNTSKDIFTLCCQNGKYKAGPVKPPPKELRQLLDGADPDSQYFFKHIRLINSNLAFAGLSANAICQVVMAHRLYACMVPFTM